MIELLWLAIAPPQTSIINLTEELTTESQPVEPKQTKHTVKKGESLTKIAKEYKTTWQRLFYKNLNLSHPDELAVGAILTIPEPLEELKVREYVIRTSKPARTAVVAKNGNTTNLYPYGECTYWVKQALPWVSNRLGNAREWAYTSGLDVHARPIVGSIGWTDRGYYGHVVAVLDVSGDQVYIQDGNYDFNGSVRKKWIHYSEYKYLY